MIHISAYGGKQSTSTPYPDGNSFVMGPEQWEGIRKQLEELKRQHPEETRADLVPDPGVPFRLLAEVMSVTAWDPSGTDLFPDIVLKSP